MTGMFPYNKRLRYPHMIKSEAETWNLFIDKFPGKYDTVDYDFRVGEGMELNNTWDDKTRNMATAISQKRIDVLAWKEKSITIIEIKRRGSLSAIGQLLGYRTLFEKDFIKLQVPKILLVCQTIDRDDRLAFQNQGIPVVVV